MYRRILGFFGGAMSESSEENQDLSQGRNNEGSQLSEENSKSSETNMASGEQGAALKDRVRKLEKELKERIEESESYKTRLHFVEQELVILKQMAKSQPAKTSTGVGDNNVHSRRNSVGEKESAGSEEGNVEKLSNENTELRDALSKTSELLKDKTDLCDNKERQNLALSNQVASLKEVVAITKDLLNIRNMEVRHLQSDVESMEGKIAEEKQRHNSMIAKMDDAVKLNSDLKKEYSTQLKIFQDLKLKYEEKVSLLMKENQKLESQIPKSSQESMQDDQFVNNDTSVPE